MSYGPPEPHVIYMQYPMANCCVCGDETPSRWGIPVDSTTGEIIANESEAEWGGKPACHSCWLAHTAGELVGTYPRY